MSARAHARALRVERVDGGVLETPVLPQYLPSAAPEHRPTPFDVLEFRRARYSAVRRE